ncbi:MAG: LPS export ABC transporter permease LptF [Ferrovum sp.]|jgi:lipopolysaccharide export system permease protein|uniref:LPS export ABC transporter permease LptF n=1 Tax=Ferrovum sp. TaxID=2609467 RepID=UPI0026204B8A|nr:LPS export ABC transporter permease LptF [Ferrovum sp.]MBW8066640.1 LPS export ABC transporter permease LptF [Ferrovum sp.]
MLFSRLLRKEFARTALMAMVILLAILLTVSLVKLLGLAAGGTLSGSAVMAMLAFGSLTYLPVLLSASIFTALLLAMTRFYRDSEMIIWQSAGVSLNRFLGPVLRFAVPMALVVALLSLVIAPWAIGQKAQYQKQLDVQDDTSQITPGVFRESHQSDQVFFVDALSQSKEKVSNVFVQSVQGHQVGVIAADSGYIATEPNGDRFVVLQRGRRYEGEPGTLNYRLVDFEQARLRIDQHGVTAAALSVKSMSVQDLLRKPTLEGWGELHWRLGLPLSLLVLAVFSVPLSYLNVRGGRSTNMIFALLAYMVYYNCMSIAQAWVAQGKLPFWIGLWPVHLLFLIVAWIWLQQRQRVWSWRWWMGQRRSREKRERKEAP